MLPHRRTTLTKRASFLMSQCSAYSTHTPAFASASRGTRATAIHILPAGPTSFGLASPWRWYLLLLRWFLSAIRTFSIPLLHSSHVPTFLFARALLYAIPPPPTTTTYIWKEGLVCILFNVCSTRVTVTVGYRIEPVTWYKALFVHALAVWCGVWPVAGRRHSRDTATHQRKVTVCRTHFITHGKTRC